MNCINCGGQLEDNNQFCQSCGTKIEKGDLAIESEKILEFEKDPLSDTIPNADLSLQDENNIKNDFRQQNTEPFRLSKTGKIYIAVFIVLIILAAFLFVNNVVTVFKGMANLHNKGSFDINSNLTDLFDEVDKNSVVLENDDIKLKMNVPQKYSAFSSKQGSKTAATFMNMTDAVIAVNALTYSTKEEMLKGITTSKLNKDDYESIEISDVEQKNIGNYTLYYNTITAKKDSITTTKQIRGIVPIDDKIVYAITVIGNNDKLEEALFDFTDFTVKNKKGDI